MESRCSCGAAVPDGAEFCSDCGRPLTERALERERRQNAVPLARVGPSDGAESKGPPLGFGSADALRSCYFSAAAAAFLANLGYLQLLCFLWYPAAGFFSVYSYIRKTGRRPSVREGARLGWITAVFTFALSTILMAVAAVLPGGPNLSEAVEETKRQLALGGQNEMTARMIEMLDNPAALGALLLVSLAISFLVTAGFTVLGGALGAKVLDRDGPDD